MRRLRRSMVAAFSVTYLNYLGVGTSQILMVLLAAQFLARFATVFFGFVCDRVGRKSVYLIGIVVSAALSFVISPLYETGSQSPDTTRW